jgi:hypothetical protein
MILEFFGFVDYIRKNLREVILEDVYLETLSTERKKQLRSKLQRMILYPNIQNIEADSLFNVVEQEITPLLTDYYIDEYIITVDCTIENDLIIKKIYKKMVFAHIDVNYQKVIDIPLVNMQIKKPAQIERIEDVFSLEKFVFNDHDYKANVTIDYQALDDNAYDTQITSSYSNDIKEVFKLTNGVAKLEIDILTKVGLDDLNFIPRVHKPCKNYTIHFNYDREKCSVTAENFGLMDFNKNAERMEYRINGNSIVIRFKNWILPGNGVIFTISKK